MVAEQPNPAAQKGVYHRSIHGGKWFMLSVVVQKFFGLIGFVILTRLLSPDDYGVYALLFIVPDLLDAVTTTGFTTALLQRKEDTEKYLHTVWTFDVVRAACIALIVFLSGGLIADFFKIPEAHIVMRLSGLMILIGALSNARQVYFFRELDFKKVFYRDLWAQMAFTLVAVCWAVWVEPSVWALFIAQVARFVTSLIVSYVLMPSKPQFDFVFTKLRDLVGYSKWIYAQSILSYMSISLDKAVLGKMLSSAELGLYARARDIPSLIISPLSALISKVGFQAFAKLQDDLSKIRDGFMKSIDTVLFLNVPFSAILVLEGGALVTIFLGPQWLPIVIPLKILAVGGLFSGITSVTRSLFNAIGRPQYQFRATLLQLVLVPTGLIIGVLYYGLWGAVTGSVLAWIVVFIYSTVLAWPVLKISVSMLIPTLIPLSCAAGVMLILDVLFRDTIHAFNSTPIILAWSIFLGIAYLVVTAAVNQFFRTGPWYTMCSVAKEIIGRRASEV